MSTCNVRRPEVARIRHSPCQTRDTLLATLADNDEVDLVVAGNADNRLASVPVRNVQGRLVSSVSQLVSVRGELVHSLLTERLEHFVLSLCVDAEGSRDPWAAEDVGGENGAD